MLKLQAEKRDIFGRQLKSVRLSGQLPAVIYGPKNKPEHLLVDAKAFKKALAEAGESSVVSLQTASGDHDVLIRDVAYHPTSGEPIHVDFYAVEKDKPVTVSVELEFVGEAPAVKSLGGTLIKVLHELEVEALPRNLPHNLEIDISVLTGMDSQILASDVKLSNGVTLITPAEEVVASISESGEEVKEEDAVVDLSSIEVEEKGKKEEEISEESENS